MIKTHVRNRTSGKTTEIITRLRENKNTAAIVFYSPMADLYPDDVASRVFTLNQFTLLKSLGDFEKIFIDEGFPQEKLAEFYFHLGRLNLDADIEVYGSIVEGV